MLINIVIECEIVMIFMVSIKFKIVLDFMRLFLNSLVKNFLYIV